MKDIAVEIWRNVSDYEGYYQISSFGRVRSLPRGNIKKARIMKPRNDRNGYRFVSFCKNGKYSKQFYVARLVAALFLSNPENKPQVNHKDGNPHNNKVENLEWCTASENIKHGYDTGLNPNKGETHYQAKLTEEQVKEIRVKYIPYKNSQYKLAKEYGVSRGCIYEIVSGINWKSI